MGDVTFTSPPADARERMQVMLINNHLETPSKRFVCGLCVGAVALYVIKPGFCFDEDGRLRQFKLFCPKEDKESTYYHFILIPMIAGCLFSQCV